MGCGVELNPRSARTANAAQRPARLEKTAGQRRRLLM
jgi:hypothetical protein